MSFKRAASEIVASDSPVVLSTLASVFFFIASSRASSVGTSFVLIGVIMISTYTRLGQLATRRP